MCPMTLCLALSLMGIEVGWDALPEGGVEYAIQLEPQTLDALRKGETVRSYIAPNIKDVRAFRIEVGTGTVRRSRLPEPANARAALPAPTAPKRLPELTLGKPLAERTAGYLAETEPTANPPPATPAVPADPPRPWATVILLLVALFFSIGGNVYLGWIAWDFRRRFQRYTESAVGA